MSMRHLFFNMITLGFFRFWGRTEMRRYFWGHIKLLGSRLEYAGRGRQLFRGFVVVLSFVSIILLGLAMVNVLLVVDPGASQVLGILSLLLTFFVLKNLARFWAWRYRLQQTRWRGIRPVVKGSAFKYMLLATWGSVLTYFTGGLMYPYARIAPRKYLLNCIHIGDRQLECTVDVGPLLGKWILTMVLIVLGTFIVGFGMSLFIGFVFAVAVTGANLGNTLNQGMIVGGAATLGIAASATIFYMRYRVQEIQYLCHCTKWGRLRFQSELQTKRVIMIQGLFVFIVLLLLGIGALTGGYFITQGHDPRVLLGRLGSLPLEQLLLVLAGLLVAFTLYSMVQMFRVTVLNHLLLKEFLSSFTVWNVDDLEEVEQDKDEIVRGGEGLAGFFDIDGGC
ncbi:MAG: hypothetical protein Alpg2KO_10000 [Alphaproteobacteria bacterium]